MHLLHEDVTSHPVLLKYLALQPPQKSLMQVALGNRGQVETSHGSATHAATGVPGGHSKTEGALLLDKNHIFTRMYHNFYHMC